MPRPPITRRLLLSGAAALAAPLLLPGRVRASDRPLVIGATLALSGPYAEEGEEQLRALRLAVDHLNGAAGGGMMATLSPTALGGSGVLGRRVGLVHADIGTDAARARRAARAMIEGDGAVMLTGGSSSGVAVAVQGLAGEAGTIFMAGVSHANDTTGKDRSAHGFRHFLNAHISALALAPALRNLHGPGQRVTHLTVANEWGRAQERSMRAATEAQGWHTGATLRSDPAATDFSGPLAQAARSGAGILVLNLYGGSLLAALRGAARAGLRESGIEIVVPLHSDLVARRAGADIAGVTGTQNWHPGLAARGSRYAGSGAFIRDFLDRHGRLPGQAAQTCYAQAILYADAVARAGSPDPCAVIEALEDHAFDGLGNGWCLYRAADHQCFKDVAIVRGSRAAAAGETPLDLVGTAPAAVARYPRGHPAFRGGDLGECARPS